MASVISSSSRRVHYQSQIYNNSLSLSQKNQQLLLNSYASCHRLLDHIKPMIGVQQDEIIDLMDNEGKLKELHTHGDDYASQYLTGRSTYYVLKVENDTAAGEKRYIPNFNLDQIDQKIYSVLTTSLNSLNKSANKTKRPTGTSKQNTPTQVTSNATQSKTKRTSNRK
ncbi:unnamed protein product [Rotaria sp. Silwood2]|nr:unnamed protein product [Rotaria sp. Silwood2]CAF2724361.1 unnamed protein product [Rotaria sp. Silwood2]CAF2951231.1 unnamed protein product [Rotaria sp. Silwood2]CAF3127783.1 unnamed protein product [Rotaria sp. Silwood2]CAF4040612.1 unnamed protein product [Rotaria sp. Silwood2]